MKTLRPPDTSAEAERIQTEIYRRLTPQQRLKIGLELSMMVRKTLAAGVRLRHPEYTEDEVRLAVIRLTLPEKLFFAAYPQARNLLP